MNGGRKGMDPSVLKAMVFSIGLWERDIETIMRGRTPRYVATHMSPVCRSIPISPKPWQLCAGCPVMSATGEDGCYGTPMAVAARVQEEGDKRLLLEACLAARNFLQLILAKGHAKASHATSPDV